MDGVPGAIEVTQQAGDVLIFVDSVVCAQSLPCSIGASRLGHRMMLSVQARVDRPPDSRRSAEHSD